MTAHELFRRVQTWCSNNGVDPKEFSEAYFNNRYWLSNLATRKEGNVKPATVERVLTIIQQRPIPVENTLHA